MKQSSRYDYIFCGAGCAGLSLLLRLLDEPLFRDKRILLIDPSPKTDNDRTWCFWERSPGFFEPVVHHRWPVAWFYHPRFSRRMELAPYQYKMVRGIDFYRHCFSVIGERPQVTLLREHVTDIGQDGTTACVKTENGQYEAEYVFSSIPPPRPLLKKKEFFLLQHFRGWLIETDRPAFDPAEARFMDFRPGQQHGTTFVYVLPLSSTRALVEYTLFTRDLLRPEQYEAGLKDYIAEYVDGGAYRVLEEETGIIPMTNHRFSPGSGRVVNLGTAGGQTKASSGFTFQFIQKHSEAILKRLRAGKSPVVDTWSRRFAFYDSVLLHILYHEKLPGDLVFGRLFEKNKPQEILRFLDNESSLAGELKVIASLPTWPFLKAALRQL